MKFLRFVVLLAIALLFGSMAFQIAQYWLGLAQYPFVSSLAIAFGHLLMLCGLGWSFYTLLTKYKV